MEHISHLLYFLHRQGWGFTVIICPLKATRENMAVNLSLVAIVSMMIMNQASSIDQAQYMYYMYN
jgi:hypothetical protein